MCGQAAEGHCRHRPERPQWLLRLPVNPESPSFTSRSSLGCNPAPPPPSWIPGQCRDPIAAREWRGAGPRPQRLPTWPPGRPSRHLRRRPLASRSCSSQTPLQPVARGLVSVCRLGPPQWGSSRPRRGPPPAPSPGRRPPAPEPRVGSAGCAGGSEHPGCCSLPELMCGATGGPSPPSPSHMCREVHFPLFCRPGAGIDPGSDPGVRRH